jgi:uncharacterized protein (TIGR04222 family)
MPNPFDLRGPQFLLFFLVFGALTLIVVARMRKSSEEPAATPPPLHDYLEIAFLRGGAAEALRVAILTLIDRGALAVVGGDKVKTGRDDAARRVATTTERAILNRCRTATKPTELFSDSTLTATVTEACQPALVRRGLLPNDDQKAARSRLFMLAAALLALVAGAKVLVAIARGRTNIAFLVIEALVFVVLAWGVTHPTRTTAGSALLEDLATLFKGLKDRAGSLQPHAGGSDFALLAAVYGVGAALPIYPDAKTLFPKAGKSSDGSGSCGSSCGSSCGGGGSCGGGCGGCGS